MLSKNYAKLDDLAGPDSFVTPPSQTDLAYILHFQKICKRYNYSQQTLPTKFYASDLWVV